ncbi:PAS domain-containing sensor histidine kinase [Bosea sp. (in: a-proteobacteria)]|uniref:sensor histidine kinase n=1 Tax=Bosea sp. (in: a-proteobacteria) TaxID=1871050 RepID=UPI002623A4E9|nr:PAS domain-containing sensor histidine kinase [Bosea sp. (in: a-proteobacteria)]MCO5092422.1 PAS domain-containing sensor histidine kinase [Bosea sp. (in: a-proteobacteria)]
MAITALRTQAAALVHASAQPDPAERQRHERFILSRLVAGGGVLGLAPAYLAWRGAPGACEAAVIVAAALAMLSVALVSRTGRLGTAHALSSAALSLFIVALASVTGGVTSPLLPWLAIVPVEAALFGASGFTLRAGWIAVAALAAAVGLDGLSLFAEAAPLAGAAVPLLAVSALVQALAATALLLRRRRVEEREQRASDARSQLLLDHVGDLVTWHDAGGAVVFANAAARTLAGAEPRELLGRGLFERVHIADRPLFLKALSDAAHGDEGVTVSFRTLFLPPAEAEGEVRLPVSLWLEMQACRVAGAASADGAAVVCVMRDVTQRRAAEEDLERGHAEALRANDVKGRFLATVSHELRTPLNAIIGFSEMLSADDNGWLDAERRLEYARIIHASGHHLLDVVNTLLDISKIESGAMTIEREPLDLAALARDCCALMALRAETGGIALDCVVGPALPVIEADRRALKQVVLNLLSNAIKFTPAEGRVTLAVVRDGDMIDISVSDTGVGIAAADLPRLGDPFFQAKGAYDRPHEGTGLGLSVVRGLVGLHRGRLTIESAPGVGTRVSVRLPVGSTDAAEPPARIATFARSPRRGLETKEPFRLTA